MSVILLVAALFAAGPHARAHEPLRVEARAAGGEELPRLSQAVSRALMATGISVVMGASSGEPCSSCLRLVVVEQAVGRYRLEAYQGDDVASASFAVSKDASLFEQARALAIEARQLIDSVPGKAASEVSRSPVAKREAGSKPAAARVAPVPAAEPVGPAPTGAVPHRQPEAVTADEPATSSTERSPPGPTLAVDTSPPADPVPEPKSVKPSIVPAKPAPAKPEPAVSANDSGAAAIAATSAPPVGPRRVWPWVATSAGVALGLAAGTCAILARQHYVELDDRRQSLASAQAHRDDGSRYQTASLVLGGASVIAFTAGLIALTRNPTTEKPKTNLALAPLDSGLMIFAQGTL